MVRRAGMIVTLLSLAVLHGQGQGPASWKLFRSTEGGFQVLMPDTPTQQPPPDKPNPNHPPSKLFVLHGKAHYAVAFSAPFTDKRSDEQRLDAALDSVFGVLKGKLIAQKRIVSPTLPGRDIQMEIPDK